MNVCVYVCLLYYKANIYFILFSLAEYHLLRVLRNILLCFCVTPAVFPHIST